MQRTRRQILDCIKLKGPLSIDQLAGQLGVMPVTIRAHVSVLERDQLLQGSECRTGRAGRPSRVYSLTDQSQEMFPKGYDNLATAILDNVKKLHGDGLVIKVVEKIGEDLANGHPEIAREKNTDGKVKEAVRIMNLEGCIATSEKQRNDYVITAHNCPYLHVAENISEVCGMEVAFLKKALGAPVKLTNSVVSGSVNCVFHVEGR